VGMTRVMPSMEFESFVREAMRQIQDLVLAQTRIPLATSSEGHELQSSPSLYRAFDAMDEILGLDYERDRGMRRDLTTDQRLYEGAGAGVQSSYETILLALERLSLPAGSVLVDLGSGYGRVGLVIGLLRPDLKFVGYEYVGHRVEVSCASAQRAGVGDRVKFFEQDLSADDFALPVADAYYLFDPFTAETYERVFAKIKELGRHKVTAVVAKGHAGRWFKAALGDASGWDTPIGFDQGTLELFRSQIR
jgi:SAM-dependent methyltransferase